MEELNKCFNCELDEKHIPLVSITYSEKKSWICPECLPTLIHHRENLLAKLNQLKEKTS